MVARRCSNPGCGNPTIDVSGRCHHHRITRIPSGPLHALPLPSTGAGEFPLRYPVPGLLQLTPAAQVVIISLSGTCGRPLLVGGCVRDAILAPGTKPKDVDIEVYGAHNIDAILTSLSRVGVVNEVGRAFSVLKVTVEGEEFDISLPRRDSKVGEGHRGFEVTADPDIDETEASGRRDFTINSLMYDPLTQEVIDCWGGLADLESRTLRHTTEAFSEDPLRVLRGVQFAARFGFRFAPETALVCQELAEGYSDLPPERVWGELEKLGTKGRHLSLALEELRATGWDRHLPQLTALYCVPQEPRWHPEGGAWEHTKLAAEAGARVADAAGLQGEDRVVIVMASLLHDVGKATHTQIHPDGRVTSHGHDSAGVEPARELMESIGCPRSIQDRVLPLIKEHMCSTGSAPTPAAVRRLARRLAPVTLQEWALVTQADHQGRGNPEAPSPAHSWLQMAQVLQVERLPAKPLLTGDHLIAAGMRPGPGFKPILAAAVEAQDGGEFGDQAGALAWFDRYLSQHSTGG